jgi:NAD(P)-dependent dehydrogenase (short-subunit alcohol dehydrogenase family)
LKLALAPNAGLPDVLDRDAVLRQFDLSGRVALFTGSIRGIGRALVECNAAVGAKVVVSSRKAGPCEALAEEIRSRGGEAIAIPAHMGDLAQVEELVKQTAGHYGGIDIVVNNAANALALATEDVSPDAWEKSYGPNLRGPFFLVKHALPYLRQSDHGAILNVLSVGAFNFSARVQMYSSAKAGMLALTRGWAAEFAPDGIRVNAIALGTVDTDMVRNNGPEAVKQMGTISLLKRIASPNEIVAPCLLLVGDAGSYITGQVLVIDGGLFPH